MDYRYNQRWIQAYTSICADKTQRDLLLWTLHPHSEVLWVNIYTIFSYLGFSLTTDYLCNVISGDIRDNKYPVTVCCLVRPGQGLPFIEDKESLSREVPLLIQPHSLTQDIFWVVGI